MAAAPVNEFSRTISVAGLKKKATRNSISATSDECAALATRFDLGALGTLDANVSLAVVDPRRSRVRAYGSLRATGIKQGGEQGEAATVQIDDAKFETFFIDEDLLSLPSSGAYDSADDDAYDEPIEDGKIDMGELVAQHLYLWISQREQALLSEQSADYAAGEVVIDTDDE